MKERMLVRARKALSEALTLVDHLSQDDILIITKIINFMEESKPNLYHIHWCGAVICEAYSEWIMSAHSVE